jgi:hypothetical protein
MAHSVVFNQYFQAPQMTTMSNLTVLNGDTAAIILDGVKIVQKK